VTERLTALSRGLVSAVTLAAALCGAAGAEAQAQPYPLLPGTVSVQRLAPVDVRGIARLQIRCAGPAAANCSGVLALTGPGVLGSVRYQLQAGRDAVLALRLSARGLRAVRGAPAQRLRVRASAGPGVPYELTTPLTLTLVGPESPYENPLRRVHRLDAWRIDEGVDYHGDGPVMALGPGVVTLATTASLFFGADGANNTIYRLTAGSLAGEYIYVAEACAPTVRVGERVSSQTEICAMSGDAAFPGIEIGFYDGPHDQDFPRADRLGTYTMSGYPDGTETGCGVAFSRFMQRLGAPPGNAAVHHRRVPPYVSTKLGTIVGSPARCLDTRHGPPLRRR